MQAYKAMWLALYTVLQRCGSEFTKSLSLEMAPHNVRVNCVCPGDVDTSLVDKQIANAQQDAGAAKAEMGQHYPLGRIGQPHEIGKLLYFY